MQLSCKIFFKKNFERLSRYFRSIFSLFRRRISPIMINVQNTAAVVVDSNKNEEEPNEFMINYLKIQNMEAKNRLARCRVRRPPPHSTRLPNGTIWLSASRGFRRTDHPKSIVFYEGEYYSRMLDTPPGSIALKLESRDNAQTMAFKVKTTCNRSIRIEPARGILKPETSVVVQLTPDFHRIHEMKRQGIVPIVIIYAIQIDSSEEKSDDDEEKEEREADAKLLWETAAQSSRNLTWTRKLPVTIEQVDEIIGDQGEHNGESSSISSCSTIIEEEQEDEANDSKKPSDDNDDQVDEEVKSITDQLLNRVVFRENLENYFDHIHQRVVEIYGEEFLHDDEDVEKFLNEFSTLGRGNLSFDQISDDISDQDVQEIFHRNFLDKKLQISDESEDRRLKNQNGGKID